MSDTNINNFNDATITIKQAIVLSRYQAATLVNKELLALYYGVGRYVSKNSRSGFWGKGAIKQISDDLQRELPGLRGFSESALRKMRLFFEEWSYVFANRSSVMNDLTDSSTFINRSVTMNDFAPDSIVINRPSSTGDLTGFRQSAKDEMQIISNFETDIDLGLLSKHISSFDSPEFFVTNFYKVGFTHHSEILAKEKSLEGRLFYVSHCAAAFWTVEALKSHLRGAELANGTNWMLVHDGKGK
jgi:hypothetical protein